jgi:hypothetical protein
MSMNNDETKTTEAALIELKAIYEAGGPSALIEATSAHTNHMWGSRLWNAAMNEKYGTTGLHKAWTNEDGTPTAEALEKFPQIGRRIGEARESIAGVWTFIGGTSPRLSAPWR